MATMTRISAEQATKRLERLVVDYFAGGGLALCVSDDESFIRLVKYSLAGLRVDVRTACREVPGFDEAVAVTNKIVERISAPLLLFMERRIHKRSCIKPIKVLKNIYGDRVRIVAVSAEVSREEIFLTHEAGADSFITKPISANALVEKIAYAIKPNNQLGVLLDRAAALIEAGDLDQAQAVAEQAFEIKPDCLKGHLLLGDVALRRGDHKTSEKHYLAAARAEKYYIEPLKKLVELTRETGDLDKRLTFLGRLDTLSPLNFERKVEIGETYLAKGDTNEAKAWFEEARRVVTRVAADMVSDSLMEIAAKIGDSDQEMALRFVTEAIEAKGDSIGREDLWMFNNRAILLRRQGLWKQAVQNYERALAVAPDDAGVLYNLGVAHAEGKDFDTAVNMFTKALEADPTLPRQAPSVAYNIAMAHHRCRNQDEVRVFLKMSLETDPDYEPAKRLLAQLSG
jgi:tetratricopeptide (TPR) repeat protein